MEYNFKKRWDENVDISWWRESRIEINKIINVYNDWQIHDDFDSIKAKKVLALIEYGKQTIGNQDGGSGYLEELEEMEQFVLNNIS